MINLFLFLNLELKVNVMLHLTVTNCHTSIISHEYVRKNIVECSEIIMLYNIYYIY